MRLTLNGTILTKLDGDARGGAALSIKARHRRADQVHRRRREAASARRVPPREHGQPDHGPGRPDGPGRKGSAASSREVSEEELKKQQEALEKGNFTLDDFRMHFQNIQKMGMKDMIGRMPGMSEMIPEGEDPEVALEARAGDDRLDDQEGARRPGHHRRRPPAANRTGQRRAAAGSEPVPQAVRHRCER